MENKSLGFSLGVADYLVKPFDRQVLLDRLHHLESAQNAQVLVVDDDEELNSFIQTLLRNDGYRVSAAYDGEQAVRMIEKDKPELVLLDLMMPNVDGFEVLERIQANPALEDVRVIVTTAKTLTAEESEELHKRAELIIEKGSRSLHEILRLIKKRLDTASQNAEKQAVL